MLITGDTYQFSGKKKAKQNDNDCTAAVVFIEMGCFSNP